MLKQFLKSFGFAFRGIKASLREQRNLKVQIFITIIMIGAGFFYNITSTEWTMILFVIGLVLSLEMINTSIESLVDLVTLERIPQAGKIKDMAAGAVLIASVVAVVIGVIVFRKYCFA